MRIEYLPWHTVEESINYEIIWLKNNILPYRSDINPLNFHDDVFYRSIAILIVSGKVNVSEYESNIDNLLQFDHGAKTIDRTHGAEWHDLIIDKISKRFVNEGCNVNSIQPSLYYGYADVFVESSDKKIYFEVDTISIFKLWLNLLLMKDISIINIKPNKIIKFKI